MDFNHKPYAKHIFKNLFEASGGQLKQDVKKVHFSRLFSSKVMSARTTGLMASAVGRQGSCLPKCGQDILSHEEECHREGDPSNMHLTSIQILGVTLELWVQEGV